MLLVLGLAKAGFGTVGEILQAPADVVLDQIEFLNFTSDYEKMHLELNREASR